MSKEENEFYTIQDISAMTPSISFEAGKNYEILPKNVIKSKGSMSFESQEYNMSSRTMSPIKRKEVAIFPEQNAAAQNYQLGPGNELPAHSRNVHPLVKPSHYSLQKEANHHQSQILPSVGLKQS